MPDLLLEIHNATKIYKQRGSGGRREVVALQDFNMSIPQALQTFARGFPASRVRPKHDHYPVCNSA